MRHDRGDRFRTTARGRNVDERVDGQEQGGPDKQHESDATPQVGLWNARRKLGEELVDDWIDKRDHACHREQHEPIAAVQQIAEKDTAGNELRGDGQGRDRV